MCPPERYVHKKRRMGFSPLKGKLRLSGLKPPLPLFTKEGDWIEVCLRSQVKNNKTKNLEKTTALFYFIKFSHRKKM